MDLVCTCSETSRMYLCGEYVAQLTNFSPFFYLLQDKIHVETSPFGKNVLVVFKYVRELVQHIVVQKDVKHNNGNAVSEKNVPGTYFYSQNLFSGISRWTDNTFHLFQIVHFKLSGSDWRVNYVGKTVNDIQRIVILAENVGGWTPSNPAASNCGRIQCCM